MNKYLALYISPIEEQMRYANATPEQKAAGMAPWMDWLNKSGEQIVDLGAPTGPGAKHSQSINWQSLQNEVSGYSIVQAESLEAARSLFIDHPHTKDSAKNSIEVHQCMQM